jgi:Gene Transfer Agent (GTA)-like protein/putative tail protein
MATILLSAAGAAIGGGVGGTFLGLTGAVIGRAAGATLGGLIDQRLFAQAAPIVDTGKVESFRVQSAQEGTVIPKVMGRMRIGGQMIWASRFKEVVTTASSGGGKGAPKPSVTTQSYSYFVSLAFALGEGEIDRVKRIWADGVEVASGDLNLTVYKGAQDQLPDPVIAAVEGLENTPAFRGTAYVVIEDLPLEKFGNRIPQLNFEVFRKAQPMNDVADDPASMIRSVCLIPGAGEYALATTPVTYPFGFGASESANVNTNRGAANVVHALDDLDSDLPACEATSLVVTWFGTDLRCGQCKMRPQVEQKIYDGSPMPWVVSGLSRANAIEGSRKDDRPVFGGTPADASVLEGIAALKERGKKVTFYPFILMDIQDGNGLVDPYSGVADQPSIPWRGRMTTSLAPQVAGTPDGTVTATQEVDQFFGSAQIADFVVNGQTIDYTGPAEWSYRRFILHYAHLCALAGGVEAFCIGSELRGLTQIRGAANTFPAVDQLILLARDVRAILGPDVEIGYAADWSEYFGYQPQNGSGDVYFHLDPLWSDADIDFVGIDNYVPLSDWRDEPGHLDAVVANSIYDLEYLQSNIEGGEGYDWYYASAQDRDVQERSSIQDGTYGEDWIYRYKDFKNWWRNAHYNRVGGVRDTNPTGWVAQSKPIRFTEFGCPAIDKGSNQPNVFLDAKSSESNVPYYSSGAPDSYLQRQYLAAMHLYWNDAANNPVSDFYGGPMVDMDFASVWAWDTRPWPDFPDRLSLWSDGGNYARGHWISGRFADQSLADVVAEICEMSGVFDYDVSALRGSLVGYAIRDVETGRQSLQSLMMAYGFSSYEDGGRLVFRTRNSDNAVHFEEENLAIVADQEDAVAKLRAPDAERAGRLRVQFWDQNQEYEAASVEARFTGDNTQATSSLQLPLVLDRGFGQNLANRLFAQARAARDEVKFALPPSNLDISLGDFVSIGDSPFTYRIDRIEDFGARLVEAVRVERGVFDVLSGGIPAREPAPVSSQNTPHFAFLDLPLLTGSEVEHAPYFGASKTPWGNGISVYASSSLDGFSLNKRFEAPAVFGVTLNVLGRAEPARWDRGAGVLVKFSDDVQSRAELDVLNGANAAAIRAGSGDWEVFQFAYADLQGDGSYRLSGLLRGQAGTEWLVPDQWPAGAEIVLLGAGVEQIELSATARGLERNYRVGPADKPVSDASYTQVALAFEGVGLRPYAPVHMRSMPDGNGGFAFRWIRRTRFDGDSWQSVEVPLGEASERYHIRVWDGAVLLRETDTTTPVWTYSESEISADGASGTITIEAAQISERFGTGPYNGITINV